MLLRSVLVQKAVEFQWFLLCLFFSLKKNGKLPLSSFIYWNCVVPKQLCNQIFHRTAPTISIISQARGVQNPCDIWWNLDWLLGILIMTCNVQINVHIFYFYTQPELAKLWLTAYKFPIEQMVDFLVSLIWPHHPGADPNPQMLPNCVLLGLENFPGWNPNEVIQGKLCPKGIPYEEVAMKIAMEMEMNPWNRTNKLLGIWRCWHFPKRITRPDMLTNWMVLHQNQSIK